MAVVNFGWHTGKTLTFSVYTAAGVEREADTAMAETPASSGLYLGTPTTIEFGDNVIVKEGNVVRGHGEYGAGVEAVQSGVIPAGYVGDYKSQDSVYFFWRTKSAPTVAGTIKVYKNDGTGEVTATTGITDDRDFDSKSNVHLCRIDLSANVFYATKRDYSVVLSAATIGGQSINIPIATFSIENRYQGIDWKRDVPGH